METSPQILQNDVENLEQRKASLLSDLDVLSKRRDELELIIADANTNVEVSRKMANDLSAKSILIDENQKKIDEQEAVKLDNFNKINTLKDEIHELEAKKSEAIRSLQTQQAVEENRLAGIKEKQNREIETHKKNLENIQRDIETATSKREQLYNENAGLERTRTEKAESIKEVEKQVDAKKSEFSSLSAQITMRRGEFERLEEEHSKKLDEREKVILEREAKSSETSARLDDRERRLKLIKADLEQIHGKPIPVDI